MSRKAMAGMGVLPLVVLMVPGAARQVPPVPNDPFCLVSATEGWGKG